VQRVFNTTVMRFLLALPLAVIPDQELHRPRGLLWYTGLIDLATYLSVHETVTRDRGESMMRARCMVLAMTTPALTNCNTSRQNHQPEALLVQRFHVLPARRNHRTELRISHAARWLQRAVFAKPIFPHTSSRYFGNDRIRYATPKGIIRSGLHLPPRRRNSAYFHPLIQSLGSRLCSLHQESLAAR